MPCSTERAVDDRRIQDNNRNLSIDKQHAFLLANIIARVCFETVA